LATVLLLFVLALISAERWARRGQAFHHTTSKYRALPNYELKGLAAALAFIVCLVPVALGFVLPAGVLTNYAINFYEETLSANYLTYAANSLTLAAFTAVLAVAIGLFMAYGVRLSGAKVIRAITRLASVGYAVPGAVLAIGIVVPLGAFDNALDTLSRTVFGIPTGLLLSGTIAGLVYGYLARFLALSHGTMESSLDKITLSMDGAARTLGHGPAGTLRRVHFPLMRGSLLTATLLVFVDCMKELPLTLILRPFNYDTLATFVYQYASDELLEESALGALSIVIAGILPVILLSVSVIRSRPGQTDTTATVAKETLP
jgi:iron(III) transport system permease protein